ncbi:hypothetical protein EAL2_c18650 [Peptoclostridium acidaminophilum DSM 3953]|uniref:Uncharacterized protein n=1 Tax=Peptoclostridium acidaminophilum DSM 3953 TaxID=1286171 RepID=W8U8G7_PEPAC|nr:hypothetical protein EAL2_c18650 [Peptoclostridium acidaminophilum DSM 3953]
MGCENSFKIVKKYSELKKYLKIEKIFEKHFYLYIIYKGRF